MAGIGVVANEIISAIAIHIRRVEGRELAPAEVVVDPEIEVEFYFI